MNRTAWLQDRRMQKFRDVLSRWDAGELSIMEAGELLGCRSGSSGGIGTAVRKTGLRGFVTAGSVSRRRNGCRPALAGRASRLSERGLASPPPLGGQFYTDSGRRWAHTCFDRAVVASRPGLQSNLSTGTHLGVRNLAPKHLGRKETTWNYLQC